MGNPQEETKISARNLKSTALISKKDDVDSFVENDDSVGVAIYYFCVRFTIKQFKSSSTPKNIVLNVVYIFTRF